MNYDFLDSIIYGLGDFQLTLGAIILWFIGLILILLGYRIVRKKLLPDIIQHREYITKEERSELYRLVRIVTLLCIILLTLVSSGFDHDLTPKSNFTFKVSYLILSVITIYLAWISNWFSSHIFIHDAFANTEDKGVSSKSKVLKDDNQIEEKRIVKIGRWALIVLAINVLVHILNLNKTIFSRQLSDGVTFDFKVSNILLVILIILGTRLIVWLFSSVILKNIYVRNGINQGASFAINQLVSYIVWTIALFIGMDAMGIDVSLLLGGAAALLVGVGLGLQQTFNDFISGIVLLFERSVKVGDMLNINGRVGTVKKIGLRSSIIESRALETLIVPNSQIVNQEVINWSYDVDKCRFDILISVAYGSDTQLVKKILLKIAKNNAYIIKFPAPFVRFVNFGESSLDFTLYFFSRNFMVIEDIKSDIRFEIDSAFKENTIDIPFPQRVVTVISDKSIKD